MWLTSYDPPLLLTLQAVLPAGHNFAAARANLDLVRMLRLRETLKVGAPAAKRKNSPVSQVALGAIVVGSMP